MKGYRRYDLTESRAIIQDAVEERIIERATQKLKLDHLVIQEGRAQNAAKTANNKDDLLEIIQHGAEKIINSKERYGCAALLA